MPISASEPNPETVPTTTAPGDVSPMSPTQQWHRYTKYPFLVAKLLFFAALIGLAYAVLHLMGSVVFPLFVSLLIAYLLDPLIDRMEEKGLSRTVAILLTLIVLIAALVGFVAFIYPKIATQIIKIAEKLPVLIGLVEVQFLPWLQAQFDVNVPPTWAGAFEQYGEQIRQAAPGVLRRVGTWMGGMITQTGVIVASLINLVMIPLFTFYFLRDFDHMTASVREFIPIYRRDFVLSRLQLVDHVVGAWFRGQVEVALILGVLYAAGLSMTFGLSGHDIGLGAAFGIISGVLNIIPYFGFVVGFGLSILVVLVDWTGWGAVIGVVGVFSVVQALEGYVITPKIVGEKVGLSPVAVIIVLLIGGELAGLLGILLAIPVAGALKVLFPDIRARYMRSAYFSGRFAAPVPNGPASLHSADSWRSGFAAAAPTTVVNRATSQSKPNASIHAESNRTGELEGESGANRAKLDDTQVSSGLPRRKPIGDTDASRSESPQSDLKSDMEDTGSVEGMESGSSKVDAGAINERHDQPQDADGDQDRDTGESDKSD